MNSLDSCLLDPYSLCTPSPLPTRTTTSYKAEPPLHYSSNLIATGHKHRNHCGDVISSGINIRYYNSGLSIIVSLVIRRMFLLHWIRLLD